MISLEVVRDAQRLAKIAGLWQTLADRTPGVSPFQLPDWQLPWWHHFGSGELCSFAFWEVDTLVGLVPAFLHEWNNRRQLTLLGSGISDYLEPLLEGTGPVSLLADRLRAENDWDLCVWQDLSSTTPWINLPGLQVDVQADMPCSAVALTGCFADYWSQRSYDLRRNINRYRKKAEQQGGPLTFTVEEFSAEAIGTLIQLHGERWQQQGEAGMVETNGSAAFLSEVTAVPSSRFFRLTWQDQVVAITVGFLRELTVYSYLSAFDARAETLGFGRYLLYRSLQWAFDQDFIRWDFLRGEEAYKASWGAVRTAKSRLIIKRS